MKVLSFYILTIYWSKRAGGWEKSEIENGKLKRPCVNDIMNLSRDGLWEQGFISKKTKI